MRIVAIRGRDLASLKGDFAIELDQPPLSHLGLFAIHGPVGSGKSTLLDAMCLALFGRTPRLSGVGGAVLNRGDDDVDQLKSNDPSTLVRRGAASAMAEVDFVGVDGRVYRARWEVKRSSRGGKAGKHGKLKGEEQRLVRLARPGNDEADVAIGDTKTETLALIADRLGLSFDELCRSVLLAQGGFQSFLQAKPNERAVLLEKVTGTEVYTRLGIAAYERGRVAQQQRTVLLDKRAACGVLDDDARAELQRSLILKSADAADADARAVALERSREARQLRKSIDEAAGALDVVEAALVERRDRHTTAVDDVAAARTRAAQLAPVIERARAADVAAKQAASADDDARAVAARAAVVDDAARAEAARAETRHAVAVAAVDAAQAARVALEARVGVVALASAVETALEQLLRARTTLDGATAVIDNAAVHVDEADTAVDRSATDVDDAVAALQAVLPAGIDADDLDAAERAVLDALVAVDDADAARVEEELRFARGVLERLTAARNNQRLREALVDDEPCSVCGSTAHPWHGKNDGDPVAALVDDEKKSIVRLEGALREHRERASRHRGRLQQLTTSTMPTTLPTLPTTTAALLALLTAIDAARGQRRLVDAARARHSSAVAAHTAARQTWAGHVGHGEAAGLAVVAARDALKSLGVDVPDDAASIKARLAGASADRRALQQAVVVEQQAGAAVAGAVAARDVAARAVVVAEAARAAAATIADERVALRTTTTSAASAARRAITVIVGADVLDLDAVARSAERAVAGADEALARAVVDVEASGREQARLLERLAERRERHERLGGRDDLDSDLGDEIIEARARQARLDASAARDATADVRAAVARDAEQQQRAAGIDAAIVKHDAEHRVWIELAELIGAADGARFRQFAQGLTLDALVGHANEHLATLAPRYRLRRVQAVQQKHDLDLVVVDTEAGDDVRSTATLSGGESFLVSLALALGLSSLSANEGARGRVESLFIDEGFSALDQETLDVALAAFDALRQTGRQIGVISHVPLLVERLGAQVRVVPLGGGASRVEIHAG